MNSYYLTLTLSPVDADIFRQLLLSYSTDPLMGYMYTEKISDLAPGNIDFEIVAPRALTLFNLGMYFEHAKQSAVKNINPVNQVVT